MDNIQIEEMELQEEQVIYLRDNLDEFIEQIIGDNTLEPYQKLICKLIVQFDRLGIKACHAVGKTWLMGRIVLAFLFLYEGSKVITTAPTFRQVVTLLWGELRKSHKGSDTYLGGKLLTNKLEIDDDWYAIGFSPQKSAGSSESKEQQGSAFQGFHAPYMLVIFDEATGVPKDIYTMAEGLLTSGAVVKWICIANPTTRASEFYRNSKLPEWHYHTINCFDSPNMIANGLTNKAKLRQEINKLKKLSDADRLAHIKSYKMPNINLLSAQWVVSKVFTWGFEHPLAKAKIFGEFPDSEDNTIISYSNLQLAFNRELEIEKHDVRRFGVDPARFGEDSTVITEIKGDKWVKKEKHRKKRGNEIADDVERMFFADDDGSKTYIVVDSTGVGASCADSLQLKKKKNELPDYVHIVEVHFAQAVCHPDAKKEKELRANYENLKSFIYFMLNEDLENNLDIPALEEYEEELPVVLYTYSKKNRLMVEGKDEFKARFGRSPDDSDSLALANASKYISNISGSFAQIALLKKPKPYSKRMATFKKKKKRGIKIPEQ